uniref:DNA-directed RNA polymerase subunit beta' n=1 Tax=Rhexinema sarcinoideum TaxID=43261 RepID=A0A1B2RYP1_9CHLO|nr:beta' subunit of RNA polymerase [Rhexinema sarcinoideum]
MSISIKNLAISESRQSPVTEVLAKTHTLPKSVAKKKVLLKKKSKRFSAIKLNQLTFLRLSLASPKRIKHWSQRILPNGEVIGEITNANTVNYKTLNPEKGGLFCERIFGPIKDFHCSCGKQKTKRNPKVCPSCGVEFISSQSRRYKMGYIQLVVPVTHVWYLKNSQNSIFSVLLDLKKKDLEAAIYCFSKFSLNRKFFNEDLLLQNIWPLLKANPFFLENGLKKEKKKSLNSWKYFFEIKTKFTKINQNFWQRQNQFDFGNKSKNWNFFISNNNILLEKNNVFDFKFKDLPFFLIQKNQNFQNFFFKKSNTLTFAFAANFAPKSQSMGAKVETSLMPNNNLINFEKKKVFFKKQNQKNENFAYKNALKFLYSKNLKRFYKQNFHFFLPLSFSFSVSPFSVEETIKIEKSENDFPFDLDFVFDKGKKIFSHTNKKNCQISEFYFQKKIALTFSKTFLKKNFLQWQSNSSNVQSLFSLQNYQIFFKNLLQIENYWIPPKFFSEKTYAFFENFLNDNFLFFLPRFRVTQTEKKVTKILDTKQHKSSLILSSASAQRADQSKKKLPQIIDNKAWKSNQRLNVLKQRQNLNFKLRQKNLNLKLFRKRLKNQKSFQKNPLGNLSFRSYFYFKLISSLKIALVIYQFKKGKKYESKNSLICFQNLIEKYKLYPFLNLKIKKPLLKKKTNQLEKQIQQNLINFAHATEDLSLRKKFNQKLVPRVQAFSSTLFNSYNFSLNQMDKQQILKSKSSFASSEPSFFANTNWDEATSKSLLVPLFSNLALNSFAAETQNVNSLNEKINKNLVSIKLDSFNQLFSSVTQKVKADTHIVKKQKKTWDSKKIAYFIEKLNENFSYQKPFFFNNYYLLSQNFQWSEHEDWLKFCNYIAPKANQTDSFIPSYFERGACLNMVSTGAGSLKIFLSALNHVEKKKNSSLTLLLKSLCQSFLHWNQKIDKIEKSSKLFLQIPKAFLIFNKQPDFDKEINLRFQRLSRLEILRAKLLRRLKLIRGLIQNQVFPEWMVLAVLPVLPPTLRPLISLEGQQVAVSDLNKFYQTILFRNKRLKRFSQGYYNKLSIYMPTQQKYAQRLLQEAVDALIENGKADSLTITASNNRPLKSLSDMLKGKKGRFRQNLLGKRVDYSGRSVIVVGPQLKLHQCGLPKEMAFVLFQPFLIRQLISKGIASNFISAKKMLKIRPDNFLNLLQEIMENRPVLLNRAPTLHRLGIQAFQPILVSGRAILLHPLVCTAFNADFDGDQMAVHIPLSLKACSEAWKLMNSRNNLLSPATGEPVLLPSQDMVLGCYYLTTLDQVKTKAIFKQSAFLLPFFNQTHVLSEKQNLAFEATFPQQSRGSCLAQKGLRQKKTQNFNDKHQSMGPPSNRKVAENQKNLKQKLILNRAQLKKNFKIENSLIKYYSNWNQVLQSLNQQTISLHSPIWFQWNSSFECSFKRENVTELRLDKFGNGLFIRQTSQNYWNYKFEKQSFYLKTTPGRVLMNLFIFEIHSQSILKKKNSFLKAKQF